MPDHWDCHDHWRGTIQYHRVLTKEYGQLCRSLRPDYRGYCPGNGVERTHAYSPKAGETDTGHKNPKWKMIQQGVPGYGPQVIARPWPPLAAFDILTAGWPSPEP